MGGVNKAQERLALGKCTINQGMCHSKCYCAECSDVCSEAMEMRVCVCVCADVGQRSC